MNGGLLPGFADAVTDAQACFRAVLDAMAHPGRIHETQGVSAPHPLCQAAAAVLLTLVDPETPLWLDPAAEPARGWIGFHTGAPLTQPGRALFAMALSLPALTEFSAGTDEMPETSATVILQVASLGNARGQRIVLEGPGLRDPAALQLEGLPTDFSTIWQRNHALFPRGIDIILCAGNRLTALPRGITVREG